MASEPQDARGEASFSTLVRQIAIGLSVVSVLLCTIVGSTVLTMQEGIIRTVLYPSETPTYTAVPAPTDTPTAVPTETHTPTLTPEPSVTATSTPTVTATATATTEEPTVTPTATHTPLPTSTTVFVPLPTSTPPCYPPLAWRRYTVRPGDTLTGLALRHGTTVSAVVRANCLSSEAIYADQRLYLPQIVIPPTASPTATTVALPPTATPTGCMPQPPAGWVLYTVQPSDSLYALALSRGTTVALVVQVNCLPSQSVSAGQQIHLPPPLPTPTATWTYVPTATVAVPTPTSTPEGTATVEPTTTPAGTPTSPPDPSPTVPATASPTTTAVPSSTLPPKPSPTLEPTATHTPTATVPPATPTHTPTATPTVATGDP